MWGQGQSGQAAKLFQITLNVSDFQTWQQFRFLTVSKRLENYLYPPFLTQVFHP